MLREETAPWARCRPCAPLEEDKPQNGQRPGKGDPQTHRAGTADDFTLHEMIGR